MLRLENIQGGYTPGNLVLQGIDLKINQGEVVGIIGLNGCGKTTLGKAIMNLMPFRTGKILYKEEDISNFSVHHIHKMGIAMVMQGGRVFPHMTILEHIQFAGNLKSDKEAKNRLQEIDEQFGLCIFTSKNSLNRKGSYLSGGEKQHLALIMALLIKPDLLIVDEISAGLSPENLNKVINAIKKIKTTRTISIMLIEQNIRLAAQLSDRLLILERGIIDHDFNIDDAFDIKILNKNIFN